MKHASLFLDILHIKKNIHPVLGPEKGQFSALYDKALRAPSRTAVDVTMVQYALYYTVPGSDNI